MYFSGSGRCSGYQRSGRRFKTTIVSSITGDARRCPAIVFVDPNGTGFTCAVSSQPVEFPYTVGEPIEVELDSEDNAVNPQLQAHADALRSWRSQSVVEGPVKRDPDKDLIHGLLVLLTWARAGKLVGLSVGLLDSEGNVSTETLGNMPLESWALVHHLSGIELSEATLAAATKRPDLLEVEL